MKIVFLGPPGSGKGTQAKLVSIRYKLAHISTGAMLRAEVAASSDLGNRVQAVINSGHLVSDELMLEVIQSRISQRDCDRGYILDGFPRTVRQAEDLETMLVKEPITHVILLELSEEELIKRLEHRRSSEARPDDDVAVQLERLRVYQQQTAPLVEFYQKTPLLRRVDSSGSVEQVQQNVIRALEAQSNGT